MQYTVYIKLVIFFHCRLECQKKVTQDNLLFCPLLKLTILELVLSFLFCPNTDIKKETEQFVKAVAKRYPGQDMPVSY